MPRNNLNTIWGTLPWTTQMAHALAEATERSYLGMVEKGKDQHWTTGLRIEGFVQEMQPKPGLEVVAKFEA